MPGTFLGMANLKGLDFSVNVVRKVRLYLLHLKSTMIEFIKIADNVKSKQLS